MYEHNNSFNQVYVAYDNIKYQLGSTFTTFQDAYAYITSLTPNPLTASPSGRLTNWSNIAGNSTYDITIYTDTVTSKLYVIGVARCEEENHFVIRDTTSYKCEELQVTNAIPSLTIEEANEILGASLVILATVWGIVMVKKLILPKKFT